jgi:hypothetical protein
MMQAAFKGVARAALDKAAKLEHLPGDHHFYVTFRTHTQGVQMADYLKDRFPDEMTIVIQHQYWDFEVFDDRFEIILKFSGVPQHMRIPFTAVTRFYDPSVNFALQFEAGEGATIIEPLALMQGPKAEEAASPESDAGTGAVISLDAFRRK